MKTGIWYTYFILIKDKKNNIINFEARPGADIYDVAKEIINYLKVTGKENDYTLIFNYKKLTINQNMTAKDVTNEYFANITSTI